MEEGSLFAADVDRLADGSVVVKAGGELDLSTAPELEALLRQGQGDLVLDFSELEFIDSTGVHVVVGAFEAAQRNGRDFAITGATGEVLRAFELVGLLDRLPFR